jgi:hypothetical protein
MGGTVERRQEASHPALTQPDPVEVEIRPKWQDREGVPAGASVVVAEVFAKSILDSGSRRRSAYRHRPKASTRCTPRPKGSPSPAAPPAPSR